MSLGSSGRIVLEIDPELKRELYSRLTGEGLTMKSWFLRVARSLLASKTPTRQPERPRPTAASRKRTRDTE